ncbi:MAG TPA: hypothetical protein VMV27_14280 [Candidatus Binataceae bacterium]|nr:hypothetical protein [Candidatus Binataceae bacterium]
MEVIKLRDPARAQNRAGSITVDHVREFLRRHRADWPPVPGELPADMVAYQPRYRWLRDLIGARAASEYLSALLDEYSRPDAPWDLFEVALPHLLRRKRAAGASRRDSVREARDHVWRDDRLQAVLAYRTALGLTAEQIAAAIDMAAAEAMIDAMRERAAA